MLLNLDGIGPYVTKDQLLETYGEERIYKAFYKDFELGTCHSPFREDESPSFSFYDKYGRIHWKDHKTLEQGDVFKFAARMCELRKMHLSFNELLNYIDKLLQQESPVISDYERQRQMAIYYSKPRTKRERVLQAIVSPGTPPDFYYRYFENQGISRNILSLYHVYLADEIWIEVTKQGKTFKVLWAESTPDNPIYFFFFPRTGHMKCYRPLEKDKKRKWISNINKKDDIQGYDQLDLEKRKPTIIVLTKSMKDVMLLRAFGIDAIAAHGESHYYDPEFIAHLRRNCKLLISLYDNDFAGMRGGITLRKMYNIPDFYIPRFYGRKDPSDLNVYHYEAFHFLMELLFIYLKHTYGIDRYTPMGIEGSGVTSLECHYSHRRKR